MIRTDPSMMASGMRISAVERERSYSLMALFTMGSGRLTRYMARGSTYPATVTGTKATSTLE
jgi:hypothetical protein